jgi:hypothetical protein
VGGDVRWGTQKNTYTCSVGSIASSLRMKLGPGNFNPIVGTIPLWGHLVLATCLVGAVADHRGSRPAPQPERPLFPDDGGRTVDGVLGETRDKAPQWRWSRRGDPDEACWGSFSRGKRQS